MSAFGTKKPGANRAVQMTYPEVFATVYAQTGAPEAFDSGPTLEIRELPSGDDLQAQFHEQKRNDANRMAMAAVASRKSSDNHLLMYGTKNPFTAVLGQRKFANPSNGAAGIGGNLYAREQMVGGGMTGGVLRSAQGQRFGKQMLLNRIPQLDAIERARRQFLAQVPITEQYGTVDSNEATIESPVSELVELNLGVQQLEDSISSGLRGINRFTLVDLASVLKILFRISSTANREEMEILNEKFQDLAGENGVLAALEEEIDQAGIEEEVTNIPIAKSVVNYTDKMATYVRKMLGVVNRSLRERQAFSKALVKQLGFTRVNVTTGIEEKQPPILAPRIPDPDEPAPEPQAEEEEEDDEEGYQPPDVPGARAPLLEEEEEEEQSEEALPSAAELTEIGSTTEGPQANVKALKHYYRSLTGKRNFSTFRGTVPTEIYKARRAKGYDRDTALESIPVMVQHSALRGKDLTGKLLFGNRAYKDSFLDVYPEYTNTKKQYPLQALFSAVDTFNQSIEEGIEGSGRSGGATGGARRRPAGVAPMTDTFTIPNTPADIVEQKDALAHAGRRNVGYTRDGRQTFAYRSGAFLNEELPPSGPHDPYLETKRQFNVVKDAPFQEARLREAANPVFNDKSQQFSPEQLAQMAKGVEKDQPAEEGGRRRRAVGRKPAAFAKKVLGRGVVGGVKNLSVAQTNAILKNDEEYQAAEKDLLTELGYNKGHKDYLKRHIALVKAAKARFAASEGEAASAMASMSNSAAATSGKGKRGGIMRGQNLQDTGFADSARLTVENGYPARGGGRSGGMTPSQRIALRRKVNPSDPAKAVLFERDPAKRAETEASHAARQKALSDAGLKEEKGKLVAKGRKLSLRAKLASDAATGGARMKQTKKSRSVGRETITDIARRLSFDPPILPGRTSRGALILREALLNPEVRPEESRGLRNYTYRSPTRKTEAQMRKEQREGKGRAKGGMLPTTPLHQGRPFVKPPKLPVRKIVEAPSGDSGSTSKEYTADKHPIKKSSTGETPQTGKGAHGLTRATLPTDREGFVALSQKLKGMGHYIRVNSGSQLKSIRANFIKKLGL